MTLILGLNLSDRIYLAADSRATDPTTGEYKDNISKIYSLIPNGGSFQKHHNIMCAVAGNVSLAKFYFESISAYLELELVEYDIRKLYSFLDEKWATAQMQRWYEKTQTDTVSCFILIAGVSRDKTKTISRSSYTKLISTYHEANKGLDLSKVKWSKNEIYDLGQITPFPVIPNHLLDIAARNSNKNEIQVADSLLFGLEIRLNRSFSTGISFNKYKAEWGQFLARGSGGIEEKDLPQSVLVDCEFRAIRTDNKLGTYIIDLVKSYFSKNTSIGGPVLVHVIKENSSIPIYSKTEIKQEQGKIFFKDSLGYWNERFSFLDYENANAEF